MSTKAASTSTALLVQAVAAQGFAKAHNNQPANFLVVVTDPVTGLAVTGLTQKQFTIINHFSIPGQVCGFSNSIATFNDVGTGAYQIQVKPKGCNWVGGEYLAQIMVATKRSNGQTVASLTIS